MKSFNFTSSFTSILFLLLIGFVSIPMVSQVQNTHEAINIDKIPPRIIRACCAFGYDLKLWGIPFVNIDQVISVDDLGNHHYMGNKQEGVGTIYTHKGGFIDIGHVRDQIDWTRFLYATILHNKEKGEVEIRLRKEAGRKTLHLNVPKELSDKDCMLLAGKIAYDFSLWHEISTWYGASTIPFISENFSSFSLEDVYSNLLGVHVGMKTLDSKLPFNEAATTILGATLDSLGIVKTAQETYDAYNAIHNRWYTSKKRIPSRHITLKRDPDVLVSSRPWLVSNLGSDSEDGITLEVPLLDTKGRSLTNFYQFTIAVTNKIPVAEIFPTREHRRINQNDFGVLLDRISNEIKTIEQVKEKK